MKGGQGRIPGAEGLSGGGGTGRGARPAADRRSGSRPPPAGAGRLDRARPLARRRLGLPGLGQRARGTGRAPPPPVPPRAGRPPRQETARAAPLFDLPTRRVHGLLALAIGHAARLGARPGTRGGLHLVVGGRLGGGRAAGARRSGGLEAPPPAGSTAAALAALARPASALHAPGICPVTACPRATGGARWGVAARWLPSRQPTVTGWPPASTAAWPLSACTAALSACFRTREAGAGKVRRASSAGSALGAGTPPGSLGAPAAAAAAPGACSPRSGRAPHPRRQRPAAPPPAAPRPAAGARGSWRGAGRQGPGSRRHPGPRAPP